MDKQNTKECGKIVQKESNKEVDILVKCVYNAIHTLTKQEQLMKNLAQYIEQKNAWARIFNNVTYDVNNLSERDCQNLYDSLDNDLSPENLTCDGERSGLQVRQFVRFYNAAAKELVTIIRANNYTIPYSDFRELNY